MNEFCSFLLKLFPADCLHPPFIWNNIISFVLILGIIVYGVFELFRFMHILRGVEDNIHSHTLKLSKFDGHAREGFEDIKDLFMSNKFLKDKWEEYEHTLIKRNNPERIFKTEPAEAYFNDSTILSSVINIRYWHALPGILVGLGILGTFIGLTLGLSKFNLGTSEEIKDSIKALMTGMTTAFSTSVWGMFLSLYFNWYEKRRFNSLSSAISSLNRQTDRLFTLATAEKIQMEQRDQLKIQTAALQAFSTDLADRIRIAMDSIMASRLDSLQGVVEKLYKEGEHSTTQIVTEIKASGDNITKGLQETVGNIMIEKLSPALEGVAKSIDNLAPIVESLRQEKQETSLDAICKLVDEFKTSLSGATNKEMEKLSDLIEKAGKSLADFPSHLEGTMILLSEQSQQMKQLLDQSSTHAQEEMQRRIAETDKFINDLAISFKAGVGEQQKATKDMTTGLMEDAGAAIAMMREEVEKTVNGFGTVIKEIQSNVEHLLIKQESNTKIIDKLNLTSANILLKGASLIENMDKTLKGVFDSIAQIKNTSDTLKSTADVFKNNAETLQLITDELFEHHYKYSEANQQTIDKITSALEESKNIMSKFNIVEKGIADIFKEIENSLNKYTEATRKNLNDCLSEFSGLFTKATEHLFGSVDYLKETVDDLEEILTSINKKK